MWLKYDKEKVSSLKWGFWIPPSDDIQHVAYYVHTAYIEIVLYVPFPNGYVVISEYIQGPVS